MADLVEQLRSLESRLEKAKLDKAKLEGQKTSIMKELDEVFEIKTLEDGENLLDDYDNAIAELEEEITNDIKAANALLD